MRVSKIEVFPICRVEIVSIHPAFGAPETSSLIFGVLILIVQKDLEFLLGSACGGGSGGVHAQDSSTGAALCIEGRAQRAKIEACESTPI